MTTRSSDPQEPSFRQRIRTAYEQFSPSYRKVADFLLDEYRMAAFLNASGVAKHLHVDPATVVRFAQRLGYPGYPELAQEIQTAVRSELVAAFSPPKAAEGESETLRPILHQAVEDINRLLVVNTPESLLGLAHSIANARRIYLLAEGESCHIAALFKVQLGLAGIEAVVVSGGRVDQGLALLDATDSDLAISLTLDPPVSEVTSTIHAVQQRGIPTYAIVRNHSSAVARMAQQVIVAPQSATNLDEPTFTQHTTALALLSAVAQLLMSQRTQMVSFTMEELQAWWESLA